MNDKLQVVLAILFVWMITSILASAIKEKNGQCGVSFPIGYVFYDNWFCPIEGGE